MLLNCKKGNVLDILIIVIILVGFGLTVLITNVLYIQMAATGGLNTTTQSQSIVSTTNEQFQIFDYAFLAIVLGLSLTSVIAAARVRTSPLFFFISLILLTIVLLIVWVAQSVFNSTSTQLGSIITNYPIMSFIMNHLLVYSIVIAIMISLALYSTRGSAGGGGL